MALLLVVAFIIGALTVVVLEAVGLWILIQRLDRKVETEENNAKSKASVSSPVDLNSSLYEKEGTLWVLAPDKVPKSGLEEKAPSEQRKRKEILEVTPLRKHAKIRDHYLILMESDGSRAEISLRGCTVVAVSATALPSRKWAKRYPIKIENKDSAIYKGSKHIYIYLETSWEKESWCKVLRLVSCDNDDRIAWFSKLRMEFQYYLASLNAGYPSFMKPSSGLNSELTDTSAKLDNPSSKVRQLLKKLTKKASKSGHENKASGTSISGHEEKKLSLKSRSFQDFIMPNGLPKMDTTGKLPDISSDDASVASSVSTFSEGRTSSDLAGIPDTDPNQKCFDEGTLCLNMVISRLFFDAKNNLQLRSSLQNRIQRALSNMRIPSYIGEVTCKAVDPGTLPPHILAMRVLPSDMNEVWSLEIDVEYLGGIVLDIETRLEIRELELEGEEARVNGNKAGEVTSELLEELKLSEETIDDIQGKDEAYHDTDNTDKPKSTGNASSQVSRWKSLFHSITKQVSQVPLSLRIRVSSLCGTIRVCMKPPPSDQIWFGFTSMPDIQFNLESSIGDHKITNGRVALFLISRFKAAIRETLVYPNSESVGIPFMSAEKNDWAPRKVAPFMWYRNNNQDSSSSNATKREVPPFQPGEVAPNVESKNENFTKSEEVSYEKSKSLGHVPEETSFDSLDPSSLINESTLSRRSFQELGTHLLEDDRIQESPTRSLEHKLDAHVQSPSRGLREEQDDDIRPRRIGAKERMRGLGKRVGEKLEVKKRHFEEKGRSFVERMKGPAP